MQILRRVPHNAFMRETNILGKPGLEMQVTLRTVGCRHGSCAFCGLGRIDSEFTRPLSRMELLAQLNRAKEMIEGGISGVQKVSIIGNSHSVLTPDVVEWDALTAGLLHIRTIFPRLRQISLESRANMISNLSISEITRAMDTPPRDCLELAVGIESGSERIRNRVMHKSLTDQQIYKAARILADYEWAMRAYFIYNCPGRPFEARDGDMKMMAEFLAGLRQKTGISLTMYMNRGYVPEEFGWKFADFRIAGERETISDIISAAKICKDGGIILDADVTGSDEAQTNASALEIKSDFADAVSRFNATQEIQALRNWLARNG